LSGNMIDSGVSESTMGLKIEKVFLLFWDGVWSLY
jgi:hypothetical protein